MLFARDAITLLCYMNALLNLFYLAIAELNYRQPPRVIGLCLDWKKLEKVEVSAI